MMPLYGPALPKVEIEISIAGVQQEQHIILQALVDSGADASMIPIRYLHRLGARIIDKRRVRGSANLSYLVDIFAVALKVGPYEHPAVEIIGNRQNDLTENWLLVTDY